MTRELGKRKHAFVSVMARELSKSDQVVMEWQVVDEVESQGEMERREGCTAGRDGGG